MKLLEYLRRSFIVRKCVVCENPIDYDRKTSICDECQKYWLSALDILCDKCGYESEYCICSNKVLSKYVDFFTFCIFYKSDSFNPVNGIVYKLKRDYNDEVFSFCAELMKNKALKVFSKQNMSIHDFYVTYPARRKKGIVKYGDDHAKVMSKYCAGKLGLKTLDCFKNLGKAEQKSLNKNERFANARESYRLIDGIDVKGKNFIIIDDVLTSGATVSACASILKENGANRIVSVCFAKDI